MLTNEHTSLGGPKITILMTVYNCERYLPESIESILKQTFHNYEFIIVNDGSTDSSHAIIKSYNDSRIKLISNRCNLGIYKSANIGLSHAQGKYVARLDADDISLPNRLKTQVDFMEKEPNVGAVGSWVTWIDEMGGYLDDYKPKHYAESIYYTLNFANCMPHSSALYRKSLLDKLHGYHNRFAYAGDFDLWQRLSKITPLAMIKSELVKLRFRTNNISFIKANEQHQTAVSIVHDNIQSLLDKICPMPHAHILNHILADLSLLRALKKNGITMPNNHSLQLPILHVREIEVFKRNLSRLHHAIYVAAPHELSLPKLENIINQKEKEISAWINKATQEKSFS